MKEEKSKRQKAIELLVRIVVSVIVSVTVVLLLKR